MTANVYRLFSYSYIKWSKISKFTNSEENTFLSERFYLKKASCLKQNTFMLTSSSSITRRLETRHYAILWPKNSTKKKPKVFTIEKNESRVHLQVDRDNNKNTDVTFEQSVTVKNITI